MQADGISDWHTFAIIGEARLGRIAREKQLDMMRTQIEREYYCYIDFLRFFACDLMPFHDSQ